MSNKKTPKKPAIKEKKNSVQEQNPPQKSPIEMVNDMLSKIGEWPLIKRLLLDLGWMLFCTIIISLFICLVFQNSLSDDLANIFVPIDLALLAVQITAYTLSVSSYQKLQEKFYEARKAYIRKIKKKPALYQKEYYQSFDRRAMANVNQFEHFKSFMAFLILFFGVCIVVGCVPTIIIQIRIIALLSYFIVQIISFLQCLRTFVILSTDSKQNLKAEMDYVKERLEKKLKGEEIPLDDWNELTYQIFYEDDDE